MLLTEPLIVTCCPLTVAAFKVTVPVNVTFSDAEALDPLAYCAVTWTLYVPAVE